MVLVPLLKISWSYMRRFISGLFIYLNGWGKIKTIIFCDMCRFYEICISVSIEKCSVAVHPGWFFCIIYGCFCIIAAELNSCDRLHSPANPRIFTIWSFILFFFWRFFWCGPFLKSLVNLLQYCFCFKSLFFGHEACGILAPWAGIKLTPPALGGEVLTTGLPGKSPTIESLKKNCQPLL